MKLTEQIELAIDACYDAILFPERWPDALQDLAQSLGAEACLVHPHDPESALSNIPISPGLAKLAELWSRVSPEATPFYDVRAGRLVREGHVALVEDQISTEEERCTHPYYQEVARQADLQWWGSACFSVESQFWCLPVFRGSQHGPFQAHEVVQLAAVGPRLSRLIGFAEKFASATSRGILATLDDCARPAATVDRDGAVLEINRAADALLGDALRLSGRRLVVADYRSQQRLQRLVRAVCRHAEPEPEPEPVVITKDGLSWLLAESMSVRALRSDVFRDAAGILTFTDLSQTSVPDRELLRIVFGLTTAEARLAGTMADGTDLTRAATILGIRRSTARSQLKAVFAKTGTRRQAQFAALAGRLRAGRKKR